MLKVLKNLKDKCIFITSIIKTNLIFQLVLLVFNKIIN